MNIQEVLENYNSIKAKICVLQKDIDRINDEVAEIQGVQLDGMPKAKGFVESGLEKQVCAKLQRVEEKEKNIKDLKFQIEIIENLIRTLKKINQDIIKMRYFEKMSIEQIATQKEREYRTIAKIIQKSIEKMQREYNKMEKI